MASSLSPVFRLPVRLAVFGLLLAALISFSPLVQATPVTGTTLTVTSTTDTSATDSACTLREAIQSANTNFAVDNCATNPSVGNGTAIVGPYTIDFSLGSSGPYSITLGAISSSTDEDANAFGDLDVKASVTIQNTSGQAITVQACSSANCAGTVGVYPTTVSRVFQLFATYTVSISNLTIKNGYNGNGGGAIYDGANSLTVSGVTFDTNHSGNSGGAVYFIGGNGATLAIKNSTFYNNNAEVQGGAVDNHTNGTVTLTNNTFVSNRGGSRGADIHSDIGTFNVYNSIFMSPVTTASCSTTSAGSFTGTNNFGSGCIGDQSGTLGALVSGTDIAASLGSNGGVTQTFALLSGSKAIDAGSDSAATSASLSTDQRGTGYQRSAGAHVDVGAYEVQAASAMVINVTSTKGDGTYGTGTTIDITVQFDKSVTVTGTPQITLETGTTDQVVDYVSGSGTDTLTFTYTVQAGDSSNDLDYTGTGALAPNSGTIKNGGVDATLTLPAPSTTGSLGVNKAIVIDAVGPKVTDVTSSTSDGAYKAGGIVSIQVTFDDLVTVTGTPQLTLETGTTDQTVNYSSGSGTNTLTFSYTVQAGDSSSDLDYASTGALSGGTIKDSVGNSATLTLPTPGDTHSLGDNKDIVIDTTEPDTSIDSGPTGSTGDNTPAFTFSGTDVGGSGVAYIECRVDSGLFATCTSPYTTTTLGEGAHTFEARAVDNAGNTDSTVASRGFSVDTGLPSAALDSAPDVAAEGGTTYSFTVKYTDTDAIDVSTLDSNDVRVTGPNGFNTLATFVTVDTNTDGTPRTATYSFTPPGGLWDSTDSGAYTIAIESGQVEDTSGNAVGSGALGTFDVTLAAEITVLRQSNVLTSGDQVEFQPGDTRTFTVRNDGSSDLELTSPVAVDGSAFALDADLGATTLASGETTTFAVTCDDEVDEAKSGEARISSNDSDENPFVLDLRCAPHHASSQAESTPGPAADTFLCTNLESLSGGSVKVGAGQASLNGATGDIYCTLLAHDSILNNNGAGIGDAQVLALGVIQAVNLYGLMPGGYSTDTFTGPVQVCLRGTGGVLFMHYNPATQQRETSWLPAVQQGDYTCVDVPSAGIVVLVSSGSPAPAAAETSSEPVSNALSACSVTTLYAARLRAEPNTSSEVLATVPYNLTLQATEAADGWLRVIYGDQQGWISADLLATAGDCG